MPPFVARQTGTRRCDHDGCTEPATSRAPRTRADTEDYLWFCREHARAFNASWNWCAGMSQDQIEKRVRRDTVWDRPTWPLGGRRFEPDPDPDDPLDLFGGGRARRATGPEEPFWPRGSPEARALDVLEFEGPVTLQAVKVHYKALAKKLHPDRTGGCKASEDRLKQINEAYATLRKSLSP